MKVREKLERMKELAGHAQERALKGEDVISMLSQIYREATEALEEIGEDHDKQNSGKS